MSRRRDIFLCLFVLLCSLLYVRFNSVEVKSFSGYPVAPDFTLVDINGNPFSLSDYRGRVVLLDFFHTNCTPCSNQFSELVILHEDFGEDLVIISISTENETILSYFGEVYGINWTIARDTSNVFDMYNVSYIPTLVIIRQDGYIRYRHEGLTQESVLILEIESLLTKTIYVDDDNVAGPWNGTKEHPYQNITSGLEHASDNDTVFVQNGTYYEHVVVNKTVSFIGEDSSTTIVDGDMTGDVVRITQDHVNITGFTIQRSGRTLFNSGISISSSAHCEISGNRIVDNEVGIYGSPKNTSISNNIIANNHVGVAIDPGATCNIISRNRLMGNNVSIHIYRANSNNVFENDMTNNWRSITLGYSRNNGFHHNYFFNNTEQILVFPSGYANFWDNGLEGNYWDNYTSVDSNHDGIGDTEHVIDENNVDRYPLMGMFHSFNTSLGYHANVISNSTIRDFQYFKDNSTIRMYVSNMTPNQTCGFCRVTIPHLLMNLTSIHVIIDNDTTPLVYYNYTLYDNSTHRWIYFAYPHSTHEIDIIPEFPSFLILALFMIATLVVVYSKTKFERAK